MKDVDSKIFGNNLVGGHWQDVKSSQSFISTNPANTDDVIGEFPLSTSEHVDAAVDAAAKAYKTWRLVPPPKRADVLFETVRMLSDKKEEMATLMTREMGKNLNESRGDVQEAIDMCGYYAGEGRRHYGITTTSELANKFAMAIRMPIGVAGLITPWNFPMAIPSWKIAPALLCGDTVVFKPSTETPAVGDAFAQIVQRAGVKVLGEKAFAGVFNVVHGSGKTVGDAMVRHPGVSMVSFTGSTEVGRNVNIECAKTFKHVSLEMGGKNVTIIMDDANLDLAVESCCWGAFGTTGQRCTASSRIVAHKDISQEFIKRFVERVRRVVVGNGLNPDVFMGPLINKAAQDKVASYVEIACNEGAEVLYGGHRLTDGSFAKGFFFEPTVLSAPDPHMRVNQEEIFGPVTCIIPAEDLEDAIRIANDVQFGLSTAIVTEGVNPAFTAIRDLNAGITYINSSTIGAEVHLPFGGTKQTGNGHREGFGALDFFSQWKAVYVDYSGKLQKAQIDNN